MPYHALLPSPLGDLTLVAEGDALTALYFPGHLRMPQPGTFGPRDDAALAVAGRQLEEYFAGERTAFDLPLAPRGGDFQQDVWRLLRAIPYGATRTYGDLARELGDPALAQAVGAANGRNPLSIVVPCHRVVGADGTLTGFAGGLAAKRFLLTLEEPAPATDGRLF
ncbi:hypothetical protein N566_22625 [Streptomycetaceae bacterium MP113-05]|nr:hypothetical protein N566_22625 [Streptomycetaceae bacterium MP113-05]